MYENRTRASLLLGFLVHAILFLGVVLICYSLVVLIFPDIQLRLTGIELFTYLALLMLFFWPFPQREEEDRPALEAPVAANSGMPLEEQIRLYKRFIAGIIGQINLGNTEFAREMSEGLKVLLYAIAPGYPGGRPKELAEIEWSLDLVMRFESVGMWREAGAELCDVLSKLSSLEVWLSHRQRFGRPR